MSNTYRGPFAKVYRALWDGTLGPNAEAWTTWVLMLAHADAEGVVEMTPEALAARGGLDPDWIRRGLGILEAPDPESRTAEQDGRRIVRLDEHRSWGWRVVNHALYRNQTDAERARSYRTRRVTPRDANVTIVTQRHQAEAEVDVESKHTPPLAALAETKNPPKRKRKEKASEPAGFVRFYEVLYPKRVSRDDAAKAWRQKILFPDDEALVEANTKLWTQRWAAEDRDLKHVPHPATFLRAGTWREPPPEE